MGILDYIRPHPVNVKIIQPRSNGYILIDDRARRIVDKKTQKHFYKLRKLGHLIKPGKYENLLKNDVMLLFSPSSGEYVQMKIEVDKMKTISEDMKFWFSNQVKAAYEKYQHKGLLEKYMPIILVVMFGVSMAFVFWGASEMMTEMSSFANTFTRASEILEKFLNNPVPTGGSGAPPV